MNGRNCLAFAFSACCLFALTGSARSECRVVLSGNETATEMTNAYRQAQAACEQGEVGSKGLPPPGAEKGLGVFGPITMTFDRIQFAFNSAELLPNAYPVLKKIATFLSMAGNDSLNISIEGHTDAIGSAPYNLTLSQERAQAVYEYLISGGKISATRLKVKGWGMSRPIEGTDSSAAINRRVEFVVYRAN
jgi:outer membrane protein OmpA-like peptidoglycan-associated protein